MEKLQDFLRVKAALEEVHAHMDLKSQLDYAEAYDVIENKHGITWDIFILMSNLSMKGKLSKHQESEMKKALQFSRLTAFQIENNPKFITAFIVACTIGLVGNLLIISHFMLKHRGKLTKMRGYSFLIIILAVVDLLVCFSLTFATYFELELVWKLGQYLCEYNGFITRGALPILSFWVLVLVSFERYRNIVKPFDKKISVKIYTLVLGVMLVLLGIVGFILHQFGVVVKMNFIKNTKGDLVCVVPASSFSKIPKREFFTNAAIWVASMMLIPVTILYYYYSRISRYMKRESSKAIQNAGQAAIQIRKRNKKALRVLFSLIVVFVMTAFPARGYLLFWSYVRIYELNGEVFEQKHFKIMIVFERIAQMLIMANNVINCFVYATIMESFRYYALNVLTFGLLRKRFTSTVRR
ncbi:neuropeptide Y receptor type 2-like [Clytia hemisphaerica]|uniref:neuropeptide Y receptor type 2-like n=1 Tax=Clytia hemisphaerica TaxID=252671 RepID=UPI0034D484BA